MLLITLLYRPAYTATVNSYRSGNSFLKTESININSLSPANNSAQVAVNVSLMIVFSDSVHNGSGKITIKKQSDNTDVEVIDVTSGQVSINDSAVSIGLSTNLPDGDSLYIFIDNGAFISAFDGTPFNGISDNSTWRFTVDVDRDGDGFYSAVDCNDNDPNVRGPIAWYMDSDHDGYGNADIYLQACSPPEGYVSNDQDCNDADSTVNPMDRWYLDNDGDGYGNPSDSVFACVVPPGYTGNNYDCDDNDSNVKAMYWYADADSDSYGNPAVIKLSCTRPGGFVDNKTDCDDTDPDVYPGAPAKPDGKDNNCDGTIDKIDQTISFDEVPSPVLGGPPVVLHATASSGLPVIFSVKGPAIVSDTLLYCFSAGPLVLIASQPGNFGYNPAADDSVSFCVNPITPAIFLSGNGTTNVVLTTLKVTGSYLWYLNDSLVAKDTIAYIVKDPGSYTLRISVNGCISDSSNPVNIVITELEGNPGSNDLHLYPNPARDHIIIETGKIVSGIRGIAIVNLDGKSLDFPIKSVVKFPEKLEIDIQNLKPGLFILSIETKNKIYREPFIKQ